MNQIDSKKRDKILKLIDEGRMEMGTHIAIDCIKQAHNWTKQQIIGYIRVSKMFEGKDLYQNEKKKHERVYAITEEKGRIFNSLVLIAMLVKDNLIIIHCQPLTKNSKEGKIHSSS